MNILQATRMTLALMVALTLSAAIVQSVPARGQAEGTKRGTIVVMVENSVTSQPLNKVALVITSETGETTKGETNDQGQFVVKDQAQGNYSIMWSKMGFTRSQDSPVRIRFLPGESSHRLNLALIPTGVIVGRVLNAQQQPAEGVSVTALSVHYHDGRPILLPPEATAAWAPGAGVKTDHIGEYRIFGLEPGDYYLAVWQSSNTSPIYYPGVPDPADASPLTIGAGAELHNSDIVMVGERSYRVRLTVVESNNCELTSVPRIFQVVRRSRNGLTVTEQLKMGSIPNLTAEGNVIQVTTQLTQGVYDLYYGYCYLVPGPRAFASVPIQVVDRDVETGTISLRPSVRLQASARTADKSASISPEHLRLLLSAEDARTSWLLPFLGNPEMASMRLDQTGTIVLNAVAPGKYHFTMQGFSSDVFLSSIRYGGREVLDTGVEIDGEPPGPLEFILDAPGATLEGTVRNAKGEPVQNALVLLLNQKQPPVVVNSAVTDQIGIYSLRGIRPGEYQLVATENRTSRTYQSEPALNDLRRRSVTVSFIKGSRRIQELTLVPQRMP